MSPYRGTPMSEFWYYAEAGETYGPITFEQLIEILTRLPSPRDVPVWRDGFDDWMAAENVREIVARLIRPPPLSTVRRPPQTKSSLVNTVASHNGETTPEVADPVTSYQQQFLNPPSEAETDYIKKYQQQFRRKRWSLARSAIYGFLLSLFVFITSNIADGGNNSMTWLRNGTFGMSAAYFLGHLGVVPLLFVSIAAIRNLFVPREH